MARRFGFVLTVLLIASSCTSQGWQAQIPTDWPFPLDQQPVQGSNGMVVSTDAYASEVGRMVLEAGGNAVDAAVAVSFALAVVNPEAGNIGGGGFMVIRFANGETAALDYRERAPQAAHRDMYLDEDGDLTDASVLGHLAAGVPGAVAGLWAAHQQHGSKPWSELVDPAIELANGFEVLHRQARSLQGAEDDLRVFPATETIFLPGGTAPEVGDTLRQSDLAQTLARIRDHGRDGFYTGLTADLIVQEMARGNGIITYEDLANYEASWRDPIVFDYRGYTVTSMAPVSSGGATLANMANILEGYDLGSLDWHGQEHTHLLAEAWKRAYADRNAYLADPDFVPMPLERMVSDDYAAERRAGIDLNAATPSLAIEPGLGTPERETNTTHFSIVDAQGNAVAVTTTINSFYGSKVTVAGAGFILNNEMDDFAARPGHANQFGLVQGENNAIEPGKRMLSAMTPTIVTRPNGNLFYVTGSPGGATIITNVFQNISNVIDFEMNVVEAVNAPRLHHQHLPDRIQYEPGALSSETISLLEAMGQTVQERFSETAIYPYIGDVQAIMVLEDGTLNGWSDPRRGGAAKGY
ncbi:MAG: gamma-glutamyltransferase [Gemmatimonadota bacterium]|nr:gamma-glutamyltransferase [Gemmatimonadota bacterium]